MFFNIIATLIRIPFAVVGMFFWVILFIPETILVMLGFILVSLTEKKSETKANIKELKNKKEGVGDYPRTLKKAMKTIKWAFDD